MNPGLNGYDVDLPNNTIRKRIRFLKKFYHHSPEDTLDIGSSNYVGRSLGIKHNTLECDFNYELVTEKNKYKVVTCFEVIEHLMNPLTLLENIHKILEDNGTLYLSTPVCPIISWFFGKYHITEYKKFMMRNILEYAGFKVVNHKIIRAWDWWFMFGGFRPFFRTWLHRYQFYECVKI